MKNIKKHFHAIVLLLGLLISTNACEDLAFGDKFLQKPPSTDVTIDTVFSTAEYARRVLWYSYRYLPMGLETSNSRPHMGFILIETNLGSHVGASW